jgi:Fic family protein
MYIWQLPEWPNFHWSQDQFTALLAGVRHRQGRLLGRMESLGFNLREEAVLQTMTHEVVKSGEIEGERLDPDQVRSSIARRLGMDIGGLVASDRNVEGVVEMTMDATHGYAEPLTTDRLFAWHGALFPAGRSGMKVIRAGKWRDDALGPMQVVSGALGHEQVHYQAPSAERLDNEVAGFLAWFNGSQDLDLVLKAGLAHLWFVTIHPFDDGNGRVARAITDMVLARSEQTARRFYGMSAQIRQERADYYRVLESTQKGRLDITAWLEWFLECLGRTIRRAQDTSGAVLKKARFWDAIADQSLNERQVKVLHRLLEGFEGNLTTSKWAAITRTSQDTAHRDILDLIDRGLLRRDAPRGRSTSYSLIDPAMADRDYIRGLVEHAKETGTLLSNAQKTERERMACAAFLRSLGIAFETSELVAGRQEPVDIEFRDARFQVTEVLDESRRHGDEWRERQTKYELAQSLVDLKEPWKNPEPVSLADIVALMERKLQDKAKKYPRTNIDILVYVNLSGQFLHPKLRWPEIGHLKKFGWRSISFVFPPYSGVVYCGKSAPTFLRNSKGRIRAECDNPDRLFEL